MFMTRPLHLFAFALATTFLVAAAVHADDINWGYTWLMLPASGDVLADAPGSGKVVFDVGTSGFGTNSSSIVAANLRTVSAAPADHPDLLKQGGDYTLFFQLTDALSHLNLEFIFVGKLSGSFSSLSTALTNSFIGPTTRELTLGTHHYVVTIGPFVAPGPPSDNSQGSIGAYVAVSDVHDVPEPSTFVLSCLGGIGLVGTSFQRLRRRWTRT